MNEKNKYYFLSLLLVTLSATTANLVLANEINNSDNKEVSTLATKELVSPNNEEKPEQEEVEVKVAIARSRLINYI